MYEIWKATLPKLKEFKPSDKVCERHFQQSDVIRNFEQVINGEVFKLERGRARLKPNAIPYLNLPSDEDIVPVFVFLNFRKNWLFTFLFYCRILVVENHQNHQ